MKPKGKNNYIILGTIAVVDISTKKHPKASMKIDLDVWLDLLDQGIGRCSNNGLGYAQTSLGGTVRQIHKLITPDFKLTVDHINHDRADNRMSNLRDASYTQQAKNAALNKNNKTGYSGITERKGVNGSTWRTSIGSNYGIKYLGSFKTLAKAVATRKAAEVELGFHTLHGAK